MKQYFTAGQGKQISVNEYGFIGSNFTPETRAYEPDLTDKINGLVGFIVGAGMIFIVGVVVGFRLCAWMR